MKKRKGVKKVKIDMRRVLTLTLIGLLLLLIMNLLMLKSELNGDSLSGELASIGVVSQDEIVVSQQDVIALDAKEAIGKLLTNPSLISYYLVIGILMLLIFIVIFLLIKESKDNQVITG